jgi:ketosteroid isomerase-like protein
MARSPREVAELTRRIVEGGDGMLFADLFAEDGVMEYPFGIPGMPVALEGRKAIREWFTARAEMRGLFEMQEVTSTIWETDDPEVVITEIVHRGHSRVLDGPYEMRALGIIRVRDGMIVRYRDFMNPLSLARLTGRIPDLVSALNAA